MGRIGVSVIPIAHRDFLEGLKALWTWRQSATGVGGILVFSLSLKDFGTPVDWAAPVIARAATCPPKLQRRRKQSSLPPRWQSGLLRRKGSSQRRPGEPSLSLSLL